VGALSCLIGKFQAQKNTFKDGVAYDALSPAERQRVLDTGYVTPDSLTKVQRLVELKMASGMSELDAAKYAHKVISDNLNSTNIRTLGTIEAAEKATFDLNRGLAMGIPPETVVATFFNSSAAVDAKFGSSLSQSIAWNQAKGSATTRALSHTGPLLEYTKPKGIIGYLFGFRDKKAEHNIYKALFGEASDPELSKFVKDLHTSFKGMGDDLKSFGFDALDEATIFKSVLGRGDKVRTNEVKYDKFMTIDRVNWDRLYTIEPGKYLTDEAKLKYLNDLKMMYMSESLTALDKTVDGRLLTFKNAADAAYFNENFGQGGFLNVLQHHVETYAREFAWAQTTGGNTSMWRASILKWVEENTPRSLAAVRDKLDTNIHNKQITFAGDIMGLVKPAFSSAKNVMISTRLGKAFIANDLQMLMGSDMAGSALGFHGVQGTGKIIRNFAKQLFSPSGAKEYHSALARAHASTERQMNILTLAIDENSSSWWERFTRRLASGTMQFGGMKAHVAAGKAAMAEQAMNDIADILATDGTAKELAPKVEWIRRFGFTDTDLQALKQTALISNTQYGHDIPALDLSKAWEAGGNARIAAQKVHRAIDAYHQGGSPQGNDRVNDLWNHMRSDSAATNVIAQVVSPLTSDIVGVTSQVIKPAFAEPGTVNKVRVVINALTRLALTGYAYLQIGQLLSGKDLLPSDARTMALVFAKVGLGQQIANLTGNLGTDGKGNIQLLDAMVMVSPFLDAGKLTYNQLHSIIEGKPNKNLTTDVRRLLSNFAVGSSLPLIGIFVQRAVMDNMYKALDPAAFERQKRNQIKYARKAGSGIYWQPGEILPGRAPDVSIPTKSGS